MSEVRCPECGARLPTGTAEGLCPTCLMAVAIGSDVHAPAKGDEYAPTNRSAGRFEPPSPESLAELFPHLEILDALGHGGMGAVYKARQTRLDRLVALKIIRPEAADDPAFAERFNREAKTLARLNHSNIVGVYDFGDVQDATGGTLYYFIMEFVDGANLRQLIQSGGMSPESALKVVPQICEALQYAHEERVVHRDIKPENILIDRRGDVKIADFGLAKLGREANEDFTLTGTHQVLGTLQYMAPEQMQGSSSVDHRADIYSLGVVFYELLTGEVPAGSFDPPSQRASVDRRLDEVVLRAMASDPERRYQSVSEIGADLGAISSVAEAAQAAAVEQGAEPWPGPSTILDRTVGAVAAGVMGAFSPDESEDETGNSSDDSVTVGRREAELGHLPDLCMVCGKPTRRRTSKKFEHAPDWAGGVIALLIIFVFPLGIVAAIILNEEVRVSSPICTRHRRHWSKLVWFASTGWMLILACPAIGYLISGGSNAIPWGTEAIVGVSLGLAVGIILYVIPLIWLCTTRVGVESLTKDTITFKRVNSVFARAAAPRRPGDQPA